MFASVDWAAVWRQGEPFLLWVGGMVLYSIFVFSFYERVSRKLIFESSATSKAKGTSSGVFWSRTLYALKYLLLAPLVLFGWFALLAALMLLLQSTMPLQEGLLLGMSMLATIRVCAFYKEQLAEDLAKVLPLALLAIFLLDRSTVNIVVFFNKLGDFPTLLSTLATYFAFTVILEFILRLYDAVVNRE